MSVEGMKLKFQPKGSMCTACKDRLKDCSGLNFYKMPCVGTIKAEGHSAMIVTCTSFKRLH